MAPKKGRGSSRAVQQTAASQRSRRGATDPNLEPINDNIEAVLTARRSGRATRGRRRERGERSGGAGQQRSQERNTSTSEGQKQQTQPPGENPTQNSAQGQQQIEGADPAAVRSNSGHQDQTTSGEQSTTLTSTAGQTINAHQTQQSSSAQTQDERPTKSEQDGSESKRRRSSDGQKPESPKKQKTNEGSKGSEAGDQSQQQRAGEKGSCVRLRELLEAILAIPPPVPPADVPYPSPATYGHPLNEDDVYRAVVSVTDAISDEGFHQFSFIDWFNLNRATMRDRNDVVQTIARPGHEMLIPWSRGGHHSLFSLQWDAEVDRFRALHFDSANGFGGRGSSLPMHYNQLRQRLQHADWTGQGLAGDAAIPPTSEEMPVVRQIGPWVCGLHVILNAWATALGLTIRPNMDASRYDQFIRDGIIFVQQAVRGNVSSEAIWAFFDCYGFIEAGQQVGEGRSFERTIRFLTRGALADHAARVRIQVHLPLGVNFDEAAADVAARMEVQDFSHIATQDFIRLFEEQQTIIASEFGHAPQGASDGPTTGERLAGLAQGEQRASDSNSDVQRAFEESLEQARTGSQSGSPPGQSGQASGSAGATTTSQTPDDISRDHAEAEALQRQLDEGAGHQRSGSSRNIPNTTGSGEDSSGTGRQGPHTSQGNMRETEAGSGNSTSSAPAEQSGSPANPEDPPVSGDEQQQEIARTTALLNRIPLFMVPGTPEYDDQQRRRQAAREEARQRIEDAHAEALREGLAASTPAIPPAAGGSQGAAQNGADPSTEGSQGAEEGTPTPTITDYASNAEDSQTKTGDTDDETLRGDSPADQDSESEQYSPPEEETPSESNAAENDDRDSLFDENADFEPDLGDGNLNGFDDDDLYGS